MHMYLEGNVHLSVYKANEIACLGYIFTTGSEHSVLQKCKPSSMQQKLPMPVAISLVKYVY